MKFWSKNVATVLSVCLFSSLSFGQIPADYQSRTALVKQELLWEEIAETPWETLPDFNNNSWSSILKNLKSLMSLSKTFDHQSDEIPEGRPKFIHTFGSVVQFELEPKGDHPFTGMYQKGASGIARLSLAASPDSIAYTPGMALKFLIDGQASRNIVVMNSLEGQGQDRNFFAKNFSNKIEEPQSWTLWLLGKVFERTRNPATDLPVAHLASVSQSGDKPALSIAPDQLIFKPSEESASAMTSDSEEDVRLSLQKIPAGTILYHVYGVLQNQEIYIGDLKTSSEFIASKYGDKKLFFQHRR